MKVERPGAGDEARGKVRLLELGFDPDYLLEAHPRLIWCRISGVGPNCDRTGSDFVTQAESGRMSITGERDGAPMKVGVALVARTREVTHFRRRNTSISPCKMRHARCVAFSRLPRQTSGK